MNLKAKLLFDFITLEKKVFRKKNLKEVLCQISQSANPLKKEKVSKTFSYYAIHKQSVITRNIIEQKLIIAFLWEKSIKKQ